MGGRAYPHSQPISLNKIWSEEKKMPPDDMYFHEFLSFSCCSHTQLAENLLPQFLPHNVMIASAVYLPKCVCLLQVDVVLKWLTQDNAINAAYLHSSQGTGFLMPKSLAKLIGVFISGHAKCR